MQTHVKVLAILYIVFGVWSLFGSLVALLAIAGIAIVPGFLIGGPMLGLGAAAATGLFGLVMSTIGSLTSVLGILGGVGILQWKAWARILLIVLGAINLVNFPLGTALGVYTLWVLLQERADRRFNASGGELFG